MKVIDLTTEYINQLSNQNDFNSYENTCPELFAHYYKFWSHKDNSKIFQEADVISSHELILSILPKIENKFSSYNIDIHNMTIILFVGMGNTNGHAFKYQNQFVVWIPIETYNNKIDTEVFITHEITHALHYTNSSKFYFENKKEQKHIGRQLITEGLATYFSKIILEISDEKALWGEYLVNDELSKWMNDCDEQFATIKTVVRNNFDLSDNHLGLFYANDKNDILNYRAGYYAGLKLVEQIIKSENLSLSEILQIPRERFEKLILSML